MKHDVISVPETGAHIATLPGTIPPAPAVMAVLDRFNREQLGSAIEVLISLLDIWDGDPDVEDNNDQEASDGDDKDVAYGEWHTLSVRSRDTLRITQNEDDEDDDPAEEDDPSGVCDEDGYNTGSPHFGRAGPGCLISDDDSEHDGREIAGAEDDFMHHDGAGAGCPLADNGIADNGGMQDAHGIDSPHLQYGIDQARSLCHGHMA